MASKSTAYANKILELVLNNVAAALIGDATGIVGSSTAGNLYVNAHIADPGAAGNQTTSVANYTGYGPVAIARDPVSKKWTVASGNAANAVDIVFPQCTGGSSTITHLSVGVAASGAGEILYRFTLTSSLAVSTTGNQIPKVVAGQATLTEN